jgi:rare lipoprotein A
LAEPALATGQNVPATVLGEELPKVRNTATTGTEVGIASWYGPGFHGRRTASGERFNTQAMTAAHKTLPFGTRVRVTSAATGKEVVVRINDRGPFIAGRIIDLSRAAALALGFVGIKQVELQVLP